MHAEKLRLLALNVPTYALCWAELLLKRRASSMFYMGTLGGIWLMCAAPDGLKPKNKDMVRELCEQNDEDEEEERT